MSFGDGDYVITNNEIKWINKIIIKIQIKHRERQQLKFNFGLALAHGTGKNHETGVDRMHRDISFFVCHTRMKGM